MLSKALQAAAGNAGEATYIDDVFSTYLYTGNGSTQTITNNIDLAGEGGLTWIKDRVNPVRHMLFDTTRGAQKYLTTNSTAAEGTQADSLTAFGATGFSLGSDAQTWVNGSGINYASWTFRKAPKFFDVVTWTGDGNATKTINHSLGSVPGCIIYKLTSGADDWYVYHRSLSQSSGVPYWLNLNTTAAETFFGGGIMLNATPTSTSFTVKGAGNGSGNTYVAYLFAHDAGGFGADSSENVISCGTFTTDAGGLATVNLGYEPQWLLVKCTSNTDNWDMMDVMRGWNMTTQEATLYANLTNAESSANWGNPTATGFEASFGASRTYIYIAIRRPMKPPSAGTEVFAPVARSGTGATATVTTGFASDLIISHQRNAAGIDSFVADRLRGPAAYLATNLTAAESTSSDSVTALNNTAYVLGADSGTDRINRSGYTYANWAFSRAPGFFDVVCYTGNGPGTQVINHNLTVVPELVINKVRTGSSITGWTVFQGSTTALTGFLRLNTTNAQGGDTLNVSSTTFTADSTIGYGMNTSTYTYVTYLFATYPGVSKVGRYTGTGTTLQINCGFTSGARFVLIKRFDSTGDWYVWDSARGIVAGNDPYLLLNSTAAEVTNTDYVDTYSAGFEISSTAPAGINANGGTYIFLAIA